MKKNAGRGLAMLLSLAMLFSMVAYSAFAEGETGTPGAAGTEQGGMPGGSDMGGGDMGGGDMGGGGMAGGSSQKATTVSSNQSIGGWVFDKVKAGGSTEVTATVTKWVGTNDAVVMLPAAVTDGQENFSVTTYGNGNQNIDSNGNKNGQTIASGNYILFPEAEASIGAVAFYDYNSLAGISVPGTITGIGTNAFLSSIPKGGFYGEKDSAIADYAAEQGQSDKFVEYSAETVKALSFTMGENGWISANGTYEVPVAMLNGDYTADITIVAHQGYQIDTVTVDGVQQDITGNEYHLKYTFTADSTGIDVTFKEDPSDTRDFTVIDYAAQYEAPAIEDGAVAEGAELPADVNTYCGVTDGADYTDALSLSSGYYYAADGKVYQTEAVYASTTNAVFFSKAEVINFAYEQDEATASALSTNYNAKGDGESLVYGEDYDAVRLYNFYSYLSSGPSSGESKLYVAFLYRELTDAEADAINGTTLWNGTYSGTSPYINTSSIFTQKGGDLTISNFTTASFIGYSGGPSEAGNFFGYGAQVLVDGSDSSTGSQHHTWINYAEDVAKQGEKWSTSNLTLVEPKILGNANDMYATGNGLIQVSGGDFFSCGSGSRGAYVSLQGQILMNATDNDGNTVLEVGEDGLTYPIHDASRLTATEIPNADLVTMVKSTTDPAGNTLANGATMRAGEFKEHDSDVSLIVSGDEASSATATDSGGGVLVSNQIVAKSYGLRSAGVYTIGADESYVYCYNSDLISYRDGGLVSATGGFGYAFNCNIVGVMGLKTRAGGNSNAEYCGLEVENSHVTSQYDYEELIDAYDVAWPTDMTTDMIDEALSGTRTSLLTMFVDKANSPYFYTASLYWWFVDRNVMPGFAEGANPGYFSVIYSDGGSVPVTVRATKLENGNYTLYGENSEWYQTHKDLTPDNDELLAYVKQIVEEYPDDSITEPNEYYYSYKPAENLLVAADSGSTLTVNFYDENSRTQWDLTGEDTSTCELVGDFFCAEDSVSSNPQLAGGPNTLIANLYSSEWTGTVLRGAADQGTVKVNLDADSVWTVTETCTVNELTLATGHELDAPEGKIVTMTVDGVDTPIAAGTYSGTVVLTVSDSFKYADDNGTGTWNWAAKYIYSARDKGLMVGNPDGTFGADTTLTRAEAAGMILAAYGHTVDETVTDTGFTDVAPDAWYAKYVAAAVKYGFVSGYGDRTFGPEKPITRAEFATMLVSAAAFTADKSVTTIPAFSDADNAWYTPYVAIAYEKGWTVGDNGKFHPNNSITRAEAATMIDGYSNALIVPQ